MTSKNIPITINGDTTVEYDETFTVTLIGATDTIVGCARFDGCDDQQGRPGAKWSIPTVNVVEGNSGVTAALVTVNLTQPAATTTTVNWTTADGKAAAGPGRRGWTRGGVLAFPPGE